MIFKIIIQNFILGISIAMPLGPASLAIIKNCAGFGLKNAIKTAVGVISADFLLLTAMFFGFSKIAELAEFKTLFPFAASCVLFFMGYKSVKSSLFKNYRQIKNNDISRAPNSKHACFFEGFTANIFNPMAIVWWVSITGAMSVQYAFLTKQIIFGLSFFVIAGIMCWFTALSFTISKTRQKNKNFAVNFKKYAGIFAGAFLVGFGIKFFVYFIFAAL